MKRPFEGLGFTREIVITRILTLAKTHFGNNESMYRRLCADAKSAAPGLMAMVVAIQTAEWTYHVLRNEQHILDVRLLKLIDEWEHVQSTATGVDQVRSLSKSDAKLLADLQSKKQAATIRAKKAAEASHADHYRKRAEIQEIWDTGKYSGKDDCAEQECAHLGMSFSAARKALINRPKPTKP